MFRAAKEMIEKRFGRIWNPTGAKMPTLGRNKPHNICILDQIVYISVIKPWSPASQLVPGVEGGENGQRRLPLEKLVA